MIIAHYKTTNIAKAPDELSKAINKYSEHKSMVCGPVEDLNIKAPPSNCDIIHAHNKVPVKPSRIKPTLVQYHSEPFQVDLKTPVKLRTVIAQYPALIKEFKNFKRVRNIIDYNTPLYEMVEVSGKIRIGYSPSRMKKLGAWQDKGYKKTVDVLNKIRNKYNNVEVDIITGVSLEECIRRKSKCNIIIDECVTVSYHRSALEGLALGKLTICSMSDEIEKMLLSHSGASNHPINNVWINTLEARLDEIAQRNDIQGILEMGWKSREWMEEYWRPQDIVNEFIKIYENL